METIYAREAKAEVFHIYSESEIIELGMIPLNSINPDYLIYEKYDNIFFFEKLEDDLFRLYSIIKRRSYYLS